MKSRFILFTFCCLLFLILFACNKTDTNNISIRTFVYDDSNIEKYFDFATITDTSYQIIALETTEEFLIGEIEKIEIKNNKIIIFDYMSRAIFLFNMDGSTHSKISRTGRGPGEYLEISAMGVGDSSIIIFDMTLRKFLEFDFNGTLIQESGLKNKIWANDIFFFNDNLYLYVIWDEEEWGNSRLYLIDDIVNQNFKYYLPFDKEPLAIGNKEPSYSLCNNNVSLIYSGCDTIFSIDKDGMVFPNYVFDFKGKRAKYPSGRVELVFKENDESRITNIEWISETDSYLFANIGIIGDDDYFIYDKNKQHYKFYDLFHNLNISRYFPFYPKWLNGNQIILTTSIFNMQYYVTVLKDDCKLDGFYDKVKSIVDNSEIEDNPVVLLFNLKD